MYRIPLATESGRGKRPRTSVSTLEILDLDAVAADVDNGQSLVLNPLNVLPSDPQERAVGYAPVKFEGNMDTYWALVDTGAQVSVISAGLASYLGLYQADMSNVLPSPFEVSGFNGKSSYMPILELQLRLGARGYEDDRWVTAHMCILDTNAYKLILGVDLLRPLEAVPVLKESRLYISRHGARFSLPLVDKPAAMGALGVRRYHDAVHMTPADNGVEVDATVCESESLSELEKEIVEERLWHTVDDGAARYVQAVDGESACDLLYLA